MASMQQSWKERAKWLKLQAVTLHYAYRDPRVPWYARAWVLLVAAYAFSPIDLIPDFIPVLGYLDDFILLPLGVALAIKMIPPEVMAASRAAAQAHLADGKPVYPGGVVVIVIIWLLVLMALFIFFKDHIWE